MRFRFQKDKAGCRHALFVRDLVVASLDGTRVNDGAAWELRFAWAKDILVVGIRADARYRGETPGTRINAMITGSIPICLSKEVLFYWHKKNRRQKIMWRITQKGISEAGTGKNFHMAQSQFPGCVSKNFATSLK
ncbi:MAG: nucleoside 2-deoxyribosyltransferase [Desulfovibrio sp.]|nr:nucleoside 2-deoxyribosyltransferase [Desulfovibrio sp.]